MNSVNSYTMTAVWSDSTELHIVLPPIVGCFTHINSQHSDWFSIGNVFIDLFCQVPRSVQHQCGKANL